MQPKLSSTPMNIDADFANPKGDGITSTMGISIQEKDDNLPREGFKPTFIMKAMPLTLWADPKHKPNQLKQDKGTVDLPMAITFSAPDPVLAISKIPQFNATDMAKECAGKCPSLQYSKSSDNIQAAISCHSSPARIMYRKGCCRRLCQQRLLRQPSNGHRWRRLGPRAAISILPWRRV